MATRRVQTYIDPTTYEKSRKIATGLGFFSYSAYVKALLLDDIRDHSHLLDDPQCEAECWCGKPNCKSAGTS